MYFMCTLPDLKKKINNDLWYNQCQKVIIGHSHVGLSIMIFRGVPKITHNRFY
jgi:hypothetical protein